jgi:site-specific DNA-cytosine methylase
LPGADARRRPRGAPDYQFTGTKSDKVKQIGNAVCTRVAKALCLEALG